MVGLIKLLSLVFILSLSVNATDFPDSPLEGSKKPLTSVMYGQGEVMKMTIGMYVKLNPDSSEEEICETLVNHAQAFGMRCKFTPNIKNIEILIKDPNKRADLTSKLIEIFDGKGGIKKTTSPPLPVKTEGAKVETQDIRRSVILKTTPPVAYRREESLEDNTEIKPAVDLPADGHQTTPERPLQVLIEYALMGEDDENKLTTRQSNNASEGSNQTSPLIFPPSPPPSSGGGNLIPNGFQDMDSKRKGERPESRVHEDARKQSPKLFSSEIFANNHFRQILKDEGYMSKQPIKKRAVISKEFSQVIFIPPLSFVISLLEDVEYNPYSIHLSVSPFPFTTETEQQKPHENLKAVPLNSLIGFWLTCIVLMIGVNIQFSFSSSSQILPKRLRRAVINRYCQSSLYRRNGIIAG